MGWPVGVRAPQLAVLGSANVKEELESSSPGSPGEHQGEGGAALLGAALLPPAPALIVALLHQLNRPPADLGWTVSTAEVVWTVSTTEVVWTVSITETVWTVSTTVAVSG